MKICTLCKQNKPLSNFRMRTKRARNSDKIYTYISSHCSECETAHRKTARTKEYREQYKARRKLNNPVLFHMQERIAQWRKKDLLSDLTVEFLVSLWESQKGLCHYTNVQMVLGGTKEDLWNSASLDKLNPELGYKQNNVVWCSYKVNSMKGNLNKQDFISLCEIISKCK